MTSKLRAEYTLTLGQLLTLCSTFLIPGLLAVGSMLSRVTTLEVGFANHKDAATTKTSEVYQAIAAGDKANADALAETKKSVDAIGAQVGDVRVSVARIVPIYSSPTH